jgi:predicted nucleic acid-binding protein
VPVGAVFVDASAWIALLIPQDALHESAGAAWRELLRADRPLITTNLVVAEAHVAVRRASGHRPAVQFLHSLGTTRRLELVRSNADLEQRALLILERYTDQPFSFVDAVSFALMRERGIADAFAFDRHFQTAGFALVS